MQRAGCLQPVVTERQGIHPAGVGPIGTAVGSEQRLREARCGQEGPLQLPDRVAILRAAFDKAIAANGNDSDQAKVYKGIAALRAGNVPLGKASFAAVSDKNGMKDIANLWGLYASSRGAIKA